MASEEKCDTQPKVMLEFCIKACADLLQANAYYKTVLVDDDDGYAFFDLKATNWTGSEVRFQGFDGYVSSAWCIAYRPYCECDTCVERRALNIEHVVLVVLEPIILSIEIAIASVCLTPTNMNTNTDYKHPKHWHHM